MTSLPGLIPLAALEAAINAALRLDPETFQRLRGFGGRVVALEFRGTPLNLYLLPGADGVQLLSAFEAEPDATLSGSPLALLRFGAGGGGLFGGEVTIRGDVELGRRFKALLEGLQIDWEEHLSHLVGDVAAHQLGNLARGVAGWGRAGLDALARDAGEYLQEERRWLPHPRPVRGWMAEVDRLRGDLDRLEARVERLRHRLAPGAGGGAA